MEKITFQEIPTDLKPQYRQLLSELEKLYKCNPKLAREFKMGPKETEGRPASTFKYPEFERKLGNRLDAFKCRLIKENPAKYEDIITIYCDLFLKLEINPINIDPTQELMDILSKKQGD